MSSAVEVRDAFRIYDSPGGGVAALRGLTIAVAAGEIVVVEGPSGAGKTTLLSVLAALEPLSAGSAVVLGVDLRRLDRRAAAAFRSQRLGFVDQHYSRALSPDLSCRRMVALQLELLGASPPAAARRAAELLDRVGLADRADDRPRVLSGGEQQRVAVCAALAHRPGLVLADEPAGELDAENGAVVYTLLAELAREVGATAVIVSHDTAAAAIADRTISIHDGRVVEERQGRTQPALVVAGGWLRIPTRLQRELGAPSRVAVASRQDALVLTPLDAAAQTDGSGPVQRAHAVPAQVAALRETTVRFGGHTVFTGLEAELARASLTAVVGRSGSGKTTLLHLLAGLERPTGGRVEVAGTSIDGLSREQLADLRRRHVALVTQEAGLVPYLTARENLELGLRIRGLPTAGAAELLRELGLEPGLDAPVAQLSAGERQRVAIARAIAAATPLLLVDEPTARLDEENARLVGDLLEHAAHGRGVAVVCATHDPSLVELADQVIPLGS